MTIEHSVAKKSPNSLMTCLLPELCSWPCSPVKCLPHCLRTHDCGRFMREPTAVCNSKAFALVSVDAALRLCEDSAGTMQAAVLFDCTAVNLSNISAASSACALGRSRPPLTGDLNVFVYWSLTPTTQFSTKWSHLPRRHGGHLFKCICSVGLLSLCISLPVCCTLMMQNSIPYFSPF